MKAISEMNWYELDAVENEIFNRRLAVRAAQIQARGLSTNVIDGYDFVIVYSPVDDLLNGIANLEECLVLLDTLREMAPVDAFRRWYPKVSDKTNAFVLDKEPDEKRIQRQALKNAYDGLEIDGRQYAELYRSTL